MKKRPERILPFGKLGCRIGFGLVPASDFRGLNEVAVSVMKAAEKARPYIACCYHPSDRANYQTWVRSNVGRGLLKYNLDGDRKSVV